MTDNVPVVNDGVKGPMASRDPSLAAPSAVVLADDARLGIEVASALVALVGAVKASPAARIAVPASILAYAEAAVAKLFPDEGAAE